MEAGFRVGIVAASGQAVVESLTQTRVQRAAVGEEGADAAGALFGAIDLGTNNCRLLIAKQVGDGFRVVDAFSRIVRLGEGMAQDNLLGPAAMARALEALQICATKLARSRCVGFRGVATEACRRAANGNAFLARIEAETGLHLEAISSGEEAALAVAGCAQLLDPTRPHAVMFDIGGGSTEVMWLANGARGWSMVDFVSLPFGVVTVGEALGAGCVAPEVYAATVARVAAALAPLEQRHRIAAEVAAGRVDMLGPSGTVTTLSALAMGLHRYQRDRVDGSLLPLSKVGELSAKLAAADFAARAGNPCIGTERADLLVAGCAILEGICSLWPVPQIRVADRGLREGILLGLMAGARA